MFLKLLFSLPVVCCCKRATSSQRRSTTISWPLVAGQHWLVSTAPPPLLLLLFTISRPCACGCAVSRQQQARAGVAEASRSQRSAQLLNKQLCDVTYYHSAHEALISPQSVLLSVRFSFSFFFFFKKLFLWIHHTYTALPDVKLSPKQRPHLRQRCSIIWTNRLPSSPITHPISSRLFGTSLNDSS